MERDRLPDGFDSLFVCCMLQIAFSPVYRLRLPEGHRFPMLKYELIYEQLLYEGTCTEANFFGPASRR